MNQDDMKRCVYVWWLVAVAVLLTQACAAKGGGNAGAGEGRTLPESGEWYAFDGDYHEEIIVPEVKAWMRVADVIYPRVCDDSETEWGAARVDSLGRDLLNRHDLPVGEQIARLYEIQNVIAYGMSYFVAIIGAQTQPAASAEVLNIIRDTKEDMAMLKGVGYPPDKLIRFEVKSYTDLGLFLDLTDPYGEGSSQAAANHQEMMRYNFALISQLFTKLQDHTQSYRYAYIVTNTTFFMTLCPITFQLAGPDFQERYQDEYIETGGYFDNLLEPVREKIVAGQTASLPVMTEKEFSEILRESSKARIRIIDLLATGISTLKYPQE